MFESEMRLKLRGDTDTPSSDNCYSKPSMTLLVRTSFAK